MKPLCQKDLGVVSPDFELLDLLETPRLGGQTAALQSDPFLLLQAPYTSPGLSLGFMAGSEGIFQARTHYGEVCGLTSKGFGKRSENQDALLKLDTPDGRTILLVLDGVAGHLGGEIAAEVIYHHVTKAVLRGATLVEALNSSATALGEYFNGVIGRSPQQADRIKDMASCAAGLEVRDQGRTVLLSNIGDCRIVHFREGKDHQGTKDHSLVQALIDAGNLSPEHRYHNRLSNIITRCISLKKGVAQDDVVGEYPPIHPESGEWSILATDGLWDNMNGKMIEQLFEEVQTPYELLIRIRSELESLVVDHQGKDDNLAIIVYRHDL